ncbi:ankyrin repeat protein [Apiospora sp. TS-2023a]
MASNNSRAGQHLDASAGREVVYCHQCENEWYRDEHGLPCPRCHCEATEIVDPQHDPRAEYDDVPALGPFNRPNRRTLHDTDSDPDEEDIEEHMHQHIPGGIFRRRSTFRAPDAQDPRNQERARPESQDDVIRRFTELLGSINGAGVVGRNGPQPMFGGVGEGGGGPQVRVTRFQSGPYSAVSSFTITSGSTRTIRPGGNGGPPEDPFQSYDIPSRRNLGSSRITLVSISSSSANRTPRVFGDLFGRAGAHAPFPMPPNFPNPHGDDEDDLGGPAFPGRPGGPGGPGGPGMDFPAMLHHLFSTVLNPNAVHGDAVYTQEGLDRIITDLMEAHPQSNAPPPASEDTISKLPRKKLDEQMLGPELKGECTICIDDVGLGDEVLVLPCKHWFHDECVVLWLKEHNTCPICRAPVEGESAGQPQRNDAPAVPEAGPSSSSRPTAAERRRSNLRQSARDRIDSIRATGGLTSDSRSASQRRSSNSPPMNPPAYQTSRVRSPSPSSRRSTFSERGSDRSGGAGGGGGGPLHWLRDTFGRNNRS